MNLNGDGVPQKLIDASWWIREVGVEMAHLTVSFRSDVDSCSKTSLADAVGDRIVVNQEKLNWNIPMSTSDRRLAQFYHQGSCVKKMGVHWLYDLSMPTKMSWRLENLAPVVPSMYRCLFSLNYLFIF